MKYSEYTEDQIKQELLLLKNQLGHFPIIREIKNSTLLNAIYKNGFNLNLFRELLKVKVLKKANGYWHNFDNLASAIKPLIKYGVFPTNKEIAKKISGGARESLRYFGGMRKVAERMGYHLSTCYQASDGHYLRSSYEYIVDEFLYSRGIAHEVDGRICKKYNYRYDFKIENSYVEIWGYQNEKYLKKRLIKECLYKKLKFHLIQIEFSLFDKPADEIEASLEQVFKEFGITKTRQLKTSEIMKVVGFWNKHRIICEINKLIYDLKKFPNQQQMRKTSGLTMAIGKHGGINNFRKLMGYPQLRTNNYWNDERIMEEFKNIARQSNTIPTYAYLKKQNKHDIMNAVSASRGRKGMKYYQEQLKNEGW